MSSFSFSFQKISIFVNLPTNLKTNFKKLTSKKTKKYVFWLPLLKSFELLVRTTQKNELKATKRHNLRNFNKKFTKKLATEEHFSWFLNTFWRNFVLKFQNLPIIRSILLKSFEFRCICMLFLQKLETLRPTLTQKSLTH